MSRALNLGAGNEELALFVQQFNNSSLSFLDFERCGLKAPAAFSLLSRLLEKANRCRKLILSSNLLSNPSDPDLAFSSFIFKAQSQLESLELDFCNLTESQLVAFAESISDSTSFKFLSARGHSLSSRVAYKFVDSLYDQRSKWLARCWRGEGSPPTLETVDQYLSSDFDLNASTQLLEELIIDLSPHGDSPIHSSCCENLLPHCGICCIAKQADQHIQSLPTVSLAKSAVPQSSDRNTLPSWQWPSRIQFRSATSDASSSQGSRMESAGDSLNCRCPVRESTKHIDLFHRASKSIQQSLEFNMKLMRLAPPQPRPHVEDAKVVASSTPETSFFVTHLGFVLL